MSPASRASSCITARAHASCCGVGNSVLVSSFAVPAFIDVPSCGKESSVVTRGFQYL